MSSLDAIDGETDKIGTRPVDKKTLGEKTPSKFQDPCKTAARLSMKCLEDNSYDRTKCAAAFNNYRECKKTWIAQRKAGEWR